MAHRALTAADRFCYWARRYPLPAMQDRPRPTTRATACPTNADRAGRRARYDGVMRRRNARILLEVTKVAQYAVDTLLVSRLMPGAVHDRATRRIKHLQRRIRSSAEARQATASSTRPPRSATTAR